MSCGATFIAFVSDGDEWVGASGENEAKTRREETTLRNDDT